MSVHGDYGDYSKNSTRATWEDVAAARATHAAQAKDDNEEVKKAKHPNSIFGHGFTAAYAN